jgi:hydroxyethylthiazole kinase-like uncharacterized protein yjeF
MTLPQWLAPLLEPEELRASDQYAIQDRGVEGYALMQRAGAALAQAAAAVLPSGRIAVLCGPGNNGGDGLVAAQVLHEQGRDVVVMTTRLASAYQGDAALALAACKVTLTMFAPGGVASPAEQRAREDGDESIEEAWMAEGQIGSLHGCTGVVDALLGTGAAGAPRGAERAAIDAVVRAGLPVVACDVPSGIDAATGAVPGSAIRAVQTVTFHRASPGHLIHPAKGLVGRLEVADIGIPAGAPITPHAGALRAAVLRELPSRGAESHKYNAGVVLVIAGGSKYPGAGVLAVRGAQRAGAGYVTALTSPEAVALIRGAAPEAIVQRWEAGLPVAALSRSTALVVGPGLGDDVHAPGLVYAALGSGKPMVLDADGLAPFGGIPEDLRRGAPLIITPHAGELGKLLGRTSTEISAARLDSAREAAERTGAVVVLKGDDTIIAGPDGLVAINDLAAPALATAGTGDVLAGAIGALLAAGVDAFTAASAGVLLHARAGRLAALRHGGHDGIVALDVAELLPGARA